MRSLTTPPALLLLAAAAVGPPSTVEAYAIPPRRSPSRRLPPRRRKVAASTTAPSSAREPPRPRPIAPSPLLDARARRDVATAVASAAVFASALLSPYALRVDPGGSDADVSRPPAASIERCDAAATTEGQRRVSDAWFAATAQYYDPTFNGLGESGWRAKEREAMDAVADAGPDDDGLVEEAIGTMLKALGDPYTRYLSPERYASLTAYATGGNQGGAGIGVQLLEDPRTKMVTVMATTEGGPAAAGGVRAGGAIVKVDGEGVEGASAEVVAAKCRGEAGKAVDLDVLRGGGDGGSGGPTEHLTLTRAKIDPNPVRTTSFASPGGAKVGALRVPSFTTETVGQMVDALRSLSGSDALAIDLRGNVGGYMPAGVDAAKLFLPARAHVIAELGKPGSPVRTYDADGVGAETTTPLYLLVDDRTASAAEIFAAALQDNRRAVVVGTTRTFGKGRIQNVQPLEGGGGIAVTRARYVTPSGRDLHGTGIVPDATRPGGTCGADDLARTCLGDVADGW
ncbi:hypothetical protein ACHAWF_001767 [Thalassiosira exigua]